MSASTAMSTPCPSCCDAMTTQRLERRPLGDASIDVCAPCRALWFDGYESVQLTPGATLALLRTIHEAERESTRPLAARIACPRCSAPLALTRDLARATRFSYYRCARGHGRFTPFVQFLLEKGFVRPLPPAEIEKLRRTVGSVRCNGCGAPIDLARDPACPYCRAPIAVLDPAALGQTMEALTAAESRRHRLDTTALGEGLLAAERLDRSLAAAVEAPDADAILAAIRMGATALDLLFAPGRG
jgi:Zn-finger nucleic acid-binding protein